MNRTIFFLFCCFYVAVATAQTDGSATAAQTDGDAAAFATKERPDAGPSPIEEKLFAHTDKEFYLAGEIVWFKLYVVDAAGHHLLGLSKVAYVELIPDDQRPVLQARIALTRGLGNGSFQLPFSIHSGNYTLRAYTNWMKNEGAAFFFEKPLTILNSLRNTGVDSTGAGGAGVTGAGGSAAGGAPYDIRFFPEGGNLIKGLPCRLAFRITDRYGKSLSCKGALVNAAGDTLSRFHTLRFGLGECRFTPGGGAAGGGAQGDGSPVKALIETEDGAHLAADLPATEAKGYTMEVTDAGNGLLQVVVRTNTNNADPSVWLYVHTRRSLRIAQKAAIAGGEARFMISRDSLDEGISHLTILDGQQVPVCERLWFVQPVSLKMELHLTQDDYTVRQKVTVSLAAKDAAGQPMEMFGSMAVILQDSLQTPSQQDIRNYLLLSSDLKGAVESPGYYFSGNDAEVAATADLLMMTQGWRRFRWTPAPSFSYPPEYAGLLVTGKITDRRTGTALAGVPAWISAPGQQFSLSYSVSDKNGMIQWDLGTLYGVHELVIQTGDARTDSLYRIDVGSPYFDAAARTFLAPFRLAPAFNDQLLAHSIGAQAQNAYQPEKRQHFIQPMVTDTAAFYGRPDKRYYLDDYTRFTSMEEVMREYVKEVHVRNNKGDFSLSVQSDQANELFFETTPLLLVDGVPISDANQVIKFDPLKFRKVEIMTKRYFLGDSLFSGIVSYGTYQGDLSGFPLDKNAYILDYEGLQLHREFYSPQYETGGQQTNRIPDLRNVLYWTPEINTDRNGLQQVSFYTSDIPGRYAVIIQGITADGKPGIITTHFAVHK
ncbi:MAG TPA: hypothetical protein VNU72_11080 [Puia sp.]|nr:hypothetical protein [Puia sp.]